jgi:hypothetical protein
MLLRIEATCDYCLALGFYVAVVLAHKALLHLALSLVSFALENLALPIQALINNLISILRLADLDDDAGRGRSVSAI